MIAWWEATAPVYSRSHSNFGGRPDWRAQSQTVSGLPFVLWSLGKYGVRVRNYLKRVNMMNSL
jgi:hypothetical protein